MASIIGFNEHNLVFMFIVERVLRVHLDREMEYGCASLHQRKQVRRTPVFLCDDVCPSESILSVGDVPSRDEDGAVVHLNPKDLL